MDTHMKFLLKAIISTAVGGTFFSLMFTGFALLSKAEWEISSDTSLPILTAIIRLDGVLFGLSAITVALFLDTLKKRGRKLRIRLLLFSASSFLSFFASLMMAFINMARSHLNLFDIFVPIGYTMLGAACATIYMLMSYVELGEFEKK